MPCTFSHPRGRGLSQRPLIFLTICCRIFFGSILLKCDSDLPLPMYPHPELGCGCDERSERRFGRRWSPIRSQGRARSGSQAPPARSSTPSRATAPIAPSSSPPVPPRATSRASSATGRQSVFPSPCRQAGPDGPRPASFLAARGRQRIFAVTREIGGQGSDVVGDVDILGKTPDRLIGGVQHFMEKPFPIEDLLDAIAEAVPAG